MSIELAPLVDGKTEIFSDIEDKEQWLDGKHVRYRDPQSDWSASFYGPLYTEEE